MRTSSAEVPPGKRRSAHERALALLRAGDWQRAHAIVAEMHDRIAFRIHALAHRIEGDRENARYWYDRAGVRTPRAKSVARELAEIEAALRAAPPRTARRGS